LIKVPRGLGTGLMKVLQRSAGEFELACGFEADRAILAGKRDDLAVLEDGLPAIFGEAIEKIANAAGLFPARRPVVGRAVDELLMLGADAPTFARFSPPENTDSRSSRLSMSGLALSSVRVVMAAGD
jgi:hypothetical protein